MLKIQENIDLKKYATFRVGGSAQYFAEVSSREELQEACLWAQENNQKIFVLGGGSNIIFSDDGFSGLVVKLKKGEIESKNDQLISWAGNKLAEVVNFSKKQGLSGMENLSGIPGTIGGAIFGNAGAFETEVGDLIEKVNVFDLEKQESLDFSQKECVFKYRESIFKKNPNWIIISVILNLEKENKNIIAEKIKKVNEKRGNKQPKDWIGSAGSFFQNPKTNDEKLINSFESEKNVKIKNNQLPAGWLIEKAGILGKEIGEAKISEKNGNFIVNTGKATSQEVIMLISFIKQRVRDQFGIELQEEVQLIGFE